GLHHKNCRCASVEVFPLPDGRRPLETALVAGMGWQVGGPVGIATAYALTLASLQKGIEGRELMQKQDSTTVPAGAQGWGRLHRASEKLGHQTAEATMWPVNPDTGKTTVLEARLFNQEPLRVAADDVSGTRRTDMLEMGVIQTDDLRKKPEGIQ